MFKKIGEQYVLTGILAASLLTNVLLAYKGHQLTTRFFELQMQALSNKPSARIGQTVLPLVGKALSGSPITVFYGSAEKPTIIYYFQPSCHFCAQNLLNMKALEEQTRGRFRFIGVAPSSEDLASYVNSNKLSFPIIHSLSEDLRLSYALVGTPDTLLVSSTGRLEGIWPGAYSDDIQKTLENRFQVHLPGLTAKEPKHLSYLPGPGGRRIPGRYFVMDHKAP